MKKTLFFLLLLPWFGFSQNLVTWNTATPSNVASNMSAQSLAVSGGVTYSMNEWEAFGFLTSGWYTTGFANPTIDTNKYLEFKVVPNTGYKINASQFKISLNSGSQAARKLQIRASVNGTTWVNLKNSATNLEEVSMSLAPPTDLSLIMNFPSGFVVMPSETLKIRVYMYDCNDFYNAKNFVRSRAYSSGTVDGPTLTGTVATAGGVNALEDTDTTNETVAVIKNVTTNDTALNTTINTPIEIVAPFLSASDGTAVVIDNTSIKFIPTHSLGVKTIYYKITGGDGTTSTSTYKVTVTAFPSPTANPDIATTGQNIPATISVLSNDQAGSGTIGTINITAQPASGTASVSGSNIIYTPTAAFVGTATIYYTVTNSNDKVSNETTATVTVQAITAAVAHDDTASASRNNAVTINVLNNDVAGNSPITTVAVTGNPAHGAAVVNTPANTITYTPDTNFTGTDSFTYRITDGYNNTSSATVSMSVLQPTTTGALCGTYVISATTQYDYPQFPTITAAITHLNANGVLCPVTFLLLDNNYNNSTGETFPITINQFTGSEILSNTVTFKPGPAKNVRIEAFRDPVTGGYTPVFSTFKIVGADNIIFDGSNVNGGTTRNLTMVNSSYMGDGGHAVNSDTKNRTVLWITSAGSNGASNITVKYCNIRQTYKNSGSNFCMGIYSGGDSMESSNQIMANAASAANSNLTVKNNDFMNVKQGVYVNGALSPQSSNIVIHQNDLGSENNEETIIQPTHLNNVNGFEFTENLIYNLRRETTAGSLVSAGIYVSGNSKNGYILKNNMRDILKSLDEGNYFAGIVLQSSETASNILVANNFILNVAGYNTSNYVGNGHGIIVVSGGGYKINHNSVVLNTNQSGSGQGFSTALYIVSGTGLDVRNNIFVNNQSGTNTRRTAIAVKAYYSNMGSIFSNLDYNSYFSADKVAYVANTWSDPGNIESFNNPDYLTAFPSWQSLTAKDAHSYDFNPTFASAIDLHLASGNSTINNAGIAIAAVTKDIDGQLRSTSAPDIGADEFGAIEMPAENTDTGIYCTSSTTWNGNAWSNGDPAADKDVIFTGNKTFAGQDLYACSIFVQNGANVNFISESNAYVTHNVNVEEGSVLVFESSSHLLQTENTQNIGYVTIKRNSSKLKWLDYVMWASPVSGDQTLLDFSPLTLTNRFYTYNTSNNLYTLVADPSAVTFAKAKGYLIRVPNNHPDAPTVVQGVFKGVPNNGNVYFPMSYFGAANSYNAVGNPYPSPISITAFIDANIDNIEGTLWVWRKTNDYTQSSYSTMTKTGYTANAAPGGTTEDNELIADPFAIAPGVGVLNTGQGFIVKAKNTQNLVFRNNMRVDINYSNFFRTAADSSPAAAQFEMSRIWLNVKGSNTDFSQALIAYSSQTTLGYDNGFDGVALTGANVDLSSIITEGDSQMKLTIQARPSFNNADVVQLGFTALVAGTYTFEIDHVDGLFAGDQAVYLVDSLTDTMYNLKDGNYSFSTEIGTFDDRFEIVYATEEELGTNIPALDAKDVIVYRDGKQISIKSPGAIKSVTVYDMLGRVLYNNSNIDASDFVTSNIDTAQQVVVVKVAFDNQQVVSKKIIMN